MKSLSRTTQHTFQIHPLIFILSLTCLIIASCEKKPQNYFQGYVEGEYLYISSPIGGRLESLPVSKGMTVAENDLLFQLDGTIESAGVGEAEQNLHRAENKLANLTKGLRPSEINAIKAKLDQAQASYDLARIEYDRREKLLREKVIAQGALDQTRAEMQRSSAAVTQLQAELETARLGARTDEVKAAQAEVEVARERVVQARWKLEQKTLNAAQGGLVFDTYYKPGEYVPLTHPVVSLLPPGNVKIRFFVPERMVGSLKSGQNVSIQFDGAERSYPATISFISPQPEYTPPVIYSRNTRSHLVFMIEASVNPSDGGLLHPGQPVDVYLESSNG